MAPLDSPQDPASVGRVTPVGQSKKTRRSSIKKAKAAKKAKAEAKRIERLVNKGVKSRTAKIESDLKAKLDKALSRPDRARSARRTGGPGAFAPKAVTSPESAQTLKQAQDRVAALKTRAASRDSSVAQAAQDELQRTLSPAEYARFAVAD